MSDMARDMARILRATACRRRMTLQQVASRARLHRRTVGRLFRGESWDMDTVQRVASALDVDLVDELYHRKHGAPDSAPEDTDGP